MSTRPLRFLGLFLACLSCSRDVAAHPRGPSSPYVVTLEDENGRELRTFHHEGQTFILGSYGDRYNVRVQNRTGRRVEAVVSVDGRDVVSGRVGDFVRERGYLIDPYGDILIEGFRQSSHAVAAFRFTSPSGSYSAQMGTPENVSVIGVAVFPERQHVIARPRPQPIARPRSPVEERARRNTSNRDSESKRGLGTGYGSRPMDDMMANGYRSDSGRGAPKAAESSSAYAEPPASYAPAPSVNNLGTEYGETVSSSVQERAFVRANPTQPAAVISLRYDDREGLIARGIQLEPVYRAYRPAPPCGPDAFPGNRFAPPPCSY